MRLTRRPGSVRVRARAVDGGPADGLARFYGATAEAPVRLGLDGEHTFRLDPGQWTLVVSSPAGGLVERAVTVKPTTTLTTVDVKFTPDTASSLLLELVDGDGLPVSGAKAWLDDKPVALPAGAAVFEGLPAGERHLRAEAPGFAPLDLPAFALVDGPQERRVELTWLPCEVRVSVHADTGVDDAQVRLMGPVHLAPAPLGADGSYTTAVRPGAWQVLVSSGRYGVVGRDLALAPGAGPSVVNLQLGERKVEVKAATVEITEQVHFRTRSATIDPSSKSVLDELAAALRVHPELARVEIQGHTDNVGSEEFNVALSRRRAEAVRAWLIERGVDPARLVAHGYGTSRSLGSNDTEAGRAGNRRVQFDIQERAEP